MQIEFIQPSSLKRSTAQSSRLTATQKVTCHQTKRFDIKDWQEADDGHLKLFLKTPLNGATEWFAFSLHVRLLDKTGELLVDPTPDPETAPQTNEVGSAPDEAPEAEANRSDKWIVLPGNRRVNLYAPICAESPNFFWYEALHGGERIPTTADQVSGIIRLAKALQRLRALIGRSFRVTSWFRPEPFNSRAGGASRSQHLNGGAVDVVVEAMTGREVANKALSLKMADGKFAFGGIGVYSGNRRHICHLDVRGYRSRWGF